MYDGAVSGFLVGGEARVQVVCSGVGTCISPGFGSKSYQEGLRDQANHPIREKAGTGAGFLRPQGKVPGDRFPESNSRRCVRVGGGEGRGTAASQAPWGEVAASLLFTWAPRGLGSPREKVQEKTGFKNSQDAILAT